MNYKNFEQDISEVILTRGKDYFDNGAVEDLIKEDGHWFANVQGSEVYTVSIKGIRSIKEWECDCPYDHGSICKHVVAVLYAVQEHAAKKPTSKSSKKKNQVDEIFKNAKTEDLLSFFKKNLRYHKDLKQKFLTEFINVLDSTDKDRYNKIVDAMIKSAGGRHGYIEYRESKKFGTALDRLLNQAEAAIQNKNYLDTLDICTAVLSKIPTLLEQTDDSSGAIQGSCHYALQILNNLLNAPVPPIFKDQVFETLLKTFEEDKTDFDFKDNLLAVLLKHDWEDSQLNKIQQVVQTAFNNLNGSFIEYNQSFYVKILIKIAIQLNNKKEKDRLIDHYLRFPDIRKIKLNLLLENEDYEAAKQIIAEGIKIAEEKRHPGTVREWKDQLIAISRLENDEETERTFLRTAFLESRHSMEYFTQLKSTFDGMESEWVEEREKIILQFFGKGKKIDYYNVYTLCNIYVEEQLWERLLNLFQTKNIHPSIVANFGNHLHDIYPNEMLEIYKPILIQSAEHSSSRPDYRKVAKSLTQLLKIKGGREVVMALLKEFRTVYIKRPAMMDELNSVL